VWCLVKCLVKSADEMAASLKEFIPKAKRAIEQFESLQRKLETDAEFRRLWESDSAQALKRVGINPDARMEVGLPPYSRGPECNWCVTPKANACHC
jgi:hypothetical protein